MRVAADVIFSRQLSVGLFLNTIQTFSASVQAIIEESQTLFLCMADDQGWGDVAYNGHPRAQDAQPR